MVTDELIQVKRARCRDSTECEGNPILQITAQRTTVIIVEANRKSQLVGMGFCHVQMRVQPCDTVGKVFVSRD